MTRFIITIIILGFIGGAVSYLGNQLGRFIGRKKMSILNLRPRHTSILITTLTGSLIAIMTLTFTYCTSWEVRTLFNGLQNFQQNVSFMTAKAIEQEQTGGVIYRPGEPLLTAVIDGSKSEENIKEQMETVLVYVNDEAIKKNKSVSEIMKTTFEVPADGKLAGYKMDELHKLIKTIHAIRGKVILKPITESYAFLGEKFLVTFMIYPYISKVYDTDETITTGLINGTRPKEEIATSISKLMIQAKITAIRKGMMENPITFKLLEIDQVDLVSTIDKIAKYNDDMKIKVKVKAPTDNRGPLEVYLDAEPITDELKQ